MREKVKTCFREHFMGDFRWFLFSKAHFIILVVLFLKIFVFLENLQRSSVFMKVLNVIAKTNIENEEISASDQNHQKAHEKSL